MEQWAVPGPGGVDGMSDLRVVLYARVSSDQQAKKDLSISAQLRALRGFATERGWTIVAEYVDEAKSGRTANRPAFLRMLAAVKHQEIDAVLVWKLDRLARNMEISTSLDAHLRKCGVKIISLHENIDDTPQGKLIARMFESFAEFYSNNLSQDIQRGLREVARRGFFPFSHAPIGYRKAEVLDGAAPRYQLSPDPTYAPVITDIFEQYASGVTGPSIAKALNDDGMPTNLGRRWTKKHLYKILRNPVYCGDITVGKHYVDALGKLNPGNNPVTVKDVHEPLVSRELFRRVQQTLELRSANQATRRWSVSPYLLSGLARCEICGSFMSGTAAKSGAYHYYVCGRYYVEGATECTGVRVRQSRLEDFVIMQVRDRILTPENIHELTEMVNEELRERDTAIQERIDLVRNELRDLANRLDRHYEALETGSLSISDSSTRIREVKTRIEDLEAAEFGLLEERDVTSFNRASEKEVLAFAEDLRQTLAKGDVEQSRLFLSSLIEKVCVGKKKVEIHYRLPVGLESSTSDLAPVLQSVTQGGA